jgi:CubicO group peptidase (beta-lactamase class C family)
MGESAKRSPNPGRTVVRTSDVSPLLHRRAVLGILVGSLLLSSCGEDPAGLVDVLGDFDGFYVERPYPWVTGSPASVGLSGGLLETAVAQADAAGYYYSLLVVRSGRLVLEHYFNGAAPEFAGALHSAAKSFTSATLGIVLDQGHLDSLDQSFAEFFPEYQSLGSDYEEKLGITLSHLLTMRAGFPDDAFDDFVQDLTSSNDWIRFTFELPLFAEPGERWAYSSMSSHLLSAVIQKATGQTMWKLAREHLFEPLGIFAPYWDEDPVGYTIGSCCLYLTPRDMARFGELYLRGGALSGREIVPAAWVHQTTQGVSACPWPSGAFEDLSYGSQWWTARIGEHQLFMAQGMAGQNIVILPDLDMVVVTTTMSEMGIRDSWNRSRETFDFIATYVIAAVEP